MYVDDDSHARAEALLERAMQDELSRSDRIELERHIAECADCAAELEASRVFRAVTAADRGDDELNDAAVAGVLARLGERESLGQRARRWFEERPWRRPAAAFAVGVAVAVVVFIAVQGRPSPRPTAAPVAAEARSLILPDGSEVTPTGQTAIDVAEQTPTRTTVRLHAGAAVFRVRHDSSRLFRVDTGVITIDDLGTVFRVEHQGEGQVRVAVSEGRVAVLHRDGGSRVEVAAGEARVFLAAPAPGVTAEAPGETAEAPAASPKPPSPAASAARAATHGRGAEDPAGLLTAADVARRAGNPKAAVVPLRRMLERYPKDPRTPSAAFILGWVLLTDLGRPREAATAFAEAERFAPRGALAEDAAARVAESWQKAGEAGRAADAARHYQRLYPNGRYVSLMRGLVGDH